MYHALISEAGNFDYVATDANLQDQIQGRFSIGTYETAEAARDAIAEYRQHNYSEDNAQ